MAGQLPLSVFMSLPICSSLQPVSLSTPTHSYPHLTSTHPFTYSLTDQAFRFVSIPCPSSLLSHFFLHSSINLSSLTHPFIHSSHPAHLPMHMRCTYACTRPYPHSPTYLLTHSLSILPFIHSHILLPFISLPTSFFPLLHISIYLPTNAPIHSFTIHQPSHSISHAFEPHSFTY